MPSVVRVKFLSGHTVDVPVEGDETVSWLREHLVQEYRDIVASASSTSSSSNSNSNSNSSDPSSLRLIFMGKLLASDSLLQEVLQQASTSTQGPPVLHAVLKPAPPPQTHTQGQGQQQAASSSAPVPPPPPPQPAAAQPPFPAFQGMPFQPQVFQFPVPGGGGGAVGGMVLALDPSDPNFHQSLFSMVNQSLQSVLPFHQHVHQQHLQQHLQQHQQQPPQQQQQQQQQQHQQQQQQQQQQEFPSSPGSQLANQINMILSSHHVNPMVAASQLEALAREVMQMEQEVQELRVVTSRPWVNSIQVRVHASLDEMDAVVDRLEQLQNGEEQSGVPSMVNYSVDTSSRPTPASSSSTAPTSTPGSSSSSSSAPTQCQEGKEEAPMVSRKEFTGSLEADEEEVHEARVSSTENPMHWFDALSETDQDSIVRTVSADRIAQSIMPNPPAFSLAYQMGMEGIAGMQLSKSAKDRLKNLQKSKEQVRGERDAVYGLKSIDSTDEESDEEGSSSSGGEENEDVDGAEQ